MNFKLKIYVLCLFLLIGNNVFSTEGFVQIIPNGNKNTCLNCHSSLNGGTSTLKEFGLAFRNNFHSWDSTLAKLDSDNDGFTNGEELQDPKGSWSFGDNSPGNFKLVTNPSNKNDFPTNIENGDNNIFSLVNFYPIPVNSLFTIELNIKEDGIVNISLMNIEGKFIGLLYSNYLKEGFYKLNFNINNLNTISLNNGIYFIEIKSNEKINRKKFIINN